MLGEQRLAREDVAPEGGGRRRAGGMSRLQVERRVADVNGVGGGRRQPFERVQQGRGVRLVVYGVLLGNSDVEERAVEADRVDAELERILAVTMPRRAPWAWRRSSMSWIPSKPRRSVACAARLWST